MVLLTYFAESRQSWKITTSYTFYSTPLHDKTASKHWTIHDQDCCKGHVFSFSWNISVWQCLSKEDRVHIFTRCRIVLKSQFLCLWDNNKNTKTKLSDAKGGKRKDDTPSGRGQGIPLRTEERTWREGCSGRGERKATARGKWVENGLVGVEKADLMVHGVLGLQTMPS